jgi:hypothetical protein
MDLSGPDGVPPPKKAKELELTAKPFHAIFTLHLDPQEQKVIYTNQNQSTWREYVTKKPEEMPNENWVTKLFDAMDNALFAIPSHWAQKFYFHRTGGTMCSSLSQSDLFTEAWRSALSTLVRTMNNAKQMRDFESGKQESFYDYLFWLTFKHDTTIDGLLAKLEEAIGKSKCDWARTSNQVNCPISQMPLEKPVWLSTTGRTYSMEWLVNAIKKAFSEELPLRLEDTTLYYYDERNSPHIEAHPHLWDSQRDGEELPSKHQRVHSLVEASLASMSFNKQDAKTYSIPEFSNTFMELLPGEGEDRNMDIGRVAKRYRDLRALKPLPQALQQPEMQGSYTLVVQNTVIKDILLWKAHLKLPICFVNVVFKNCQVTHSCWCCMQLKRCRFEQCVFKVQHIERCEFINCQFVDCLFESHGVDLASLEADAAALASKFDVQGSVKYFACRLVAPPGQPERQTRAAK